MPVPSSNSGGATKRVAESPEAPEVELIAHFIMLHGREPEIGHIL
ncbi:hypothetical protein CZ674_01800 [Agrococcus casei LMG 22410]|uniref:Uncharacterized protein n=1 Tax=Agrococcus casei LMG 22410 TaxID=1255656 RepID=A0A1R4EZG3_9MICO|nr:hypothetical protein CZ674_01800 [Agrococcus casei LMG 22410]